jgi:hypothetical protein
VDKNETTIIIPRSHIHHFRRDLQDWQIKFWPFNRTTDGYEIRLSLDDTDSRLTALMLKYGFET